MEYLKSWFDVKQWWCYNNEEWDKLLRIEARFHHTLMFIFGHAIILVKIKAMILMIEAIIVRTEANYWGMSSYFFADYLFLVNIVRNQSKWRNDARGTEKINSHVCTHPKLFSPCWIFLRVSHAFNHVCRAGPEMLPGIDPVLNKCVI